MKIGFVGCLLFIFLYIYIYVTPKDRLMLHGSLSRSCTPDLPHDGQVRRWGEYVVVEFFVFVGLHLYLRVGF